MVKYIYGVLVLICLLSTTAFPQQERCRSAQESVDRASERLQQGASRAEVENILQQLKSATELCPNLGAAWYFRSVCEKLLDNQRAADYALSRAKELGYKEPHQRDNSVALATPSESAPKISATPLPADSPKPSAPQARTDQRGVGLAHSKPVKTLPSVGKRYALIVGVDQYADTQISTLGGSTNDAKMLADTLISNAGFPKEQVILLASDQPFERQPTRGNILRRLSNFAAVVPKDGLLLFAFAGHGAERGSQAFLLPSDAQVSDDVNLLEQTAINVVSIKDWIRKSGVAQVVLILDACRNDPAGRANADNPLTKTYTNGFNFDVRNREVTAFATLYATEVGYRAYEYKEKRQGYFTWMLGEALRGGAANEKGEITLAGLIKYLQERVPKQVLIDLGPGKRQVPWAVVEGYQANDLVIAITARKP